MDQRRGSIAKSRRFDLSTGSAATPRISGRSQFVGRISDQSIGEQRITSIIAGEAVREIRLEDGQIVAALIRSTEVISVQL
jgi:molybdopterin-binding protein